MYCYSVGDYERFYLTVKSKRIVWELKVNSLGYDLDFADCRKLHKELFNKWNDPSYWDVSEAFRDGHY